MTERKAKSAGDEKLVENDPLSVRELMAQGREPTNKQLRREPVPYIRPHKVNNRLYYCYVDGAESEKYLGTADFVLKAVTMLREARKHGKGR